MNADLYNIYFNSFSTYLTGRIKPGWGMKMTIYPFAQGAVIVVVMKQGIANTLIKKSSSANLGEALSMTSLFTQEKITPIANKTVGDTQIGVLSLTQYVLLKNNREQSWSVAAAQSDIDEIITKAKAKYGKK